MVRRTRTTVKDLKEVLRNCQPSADFDPKPNAKLINEIFKKTKYERFYPELLNCTKCIIASSHSATNASSCLRVISSFLDLTAHRGRGSNAAVVTKRMPTRSDPDGLGSTERDSTKKQRIRDRLYLDLAALCDAESSAIRRNACNALALFLGGEERDIHINENVVDTVRDSLVKCAYDSSPVVVAEAIEALVPLQQPDDEHDPVIQAYLWHLRNSSCISVRKMILEKIALSPKTIDAVLGCLKDPDRNVRSEAYKVLGRRVPCPGLRIVQRVALLQLGFLEVDFQAKYNFEHILLVQWFASCKWQLAELVTLLDVATSTDVAKKLFQVEMRLHGALNIAKTFYNTAVKKRSFRTGLKLPGEDLSCGELFVWSCLCDYASRTDADHVAVDYILEKMSPDCPDLLNEIGTRYLPEFADGRKKMNCLDDVFYLDQILLVLSTLDVGSEDNREEVVQLMKRLVTDFNAAAVLFPRIVNILSKAIFDTQEFTGLVSQLVMALGNTGSEKQAISGSSSPDTSADLLRGNKQLRLLREMLKLSRMRVFSDEIELFYEEIVKPQLTSLNWQNRASAFCALAMLSTLDRDIAKKSLLLFVGASQLDELFAANEALKAMFDIVMVLQLDIETFPLNEHSQRIYDVIVSMLDSEYEVLRETAVEGFCKLYVAGICTSPVLLSKLIMIWFSADLCPPVCQTRWHLYHFFAVFGEEESGLFEKCLAPCLRSISTEPKKLQTALAPAIFNLICELKGPGNLKERQLDLFCKLTEAARTDHELERPVAIILPTLKGVRKSQLTRQQSDYLGGILPQMAEGLSMMSKRRVTAISNRLFQDENDPTNNIIVD